MFLMAAAYISQLLLLHSSHHLYIVFASYLSWLPLIYHSCHLVHHCRHEGADHSISRGKEFRCGVKKCVFTVAIGGFFLYLSSWSDFSFLPSHCGGNIKKKKKNRYWSPFSQPLAVGLFFHRILSWELLFCWQNLDGDFSFIWSVGVRFSWWVYFFA